MSLTIAEKGISTTPVVLDNTQIQTINTNSVPVADKSDLSTTASELKDLPINLNSTKLDKENDKTEFEFSFSEKKFKNITANGHYSEEQKTLFLNLNFKLDKTEGNDRQNKSQSYEANLSIDAAKIEINSASRKVIKDNIHSFLSRVLSNLSQMINSNEDYIEGITFDKEDIQGLMGVGDKDISKLLHEIINLLETVSKIKRDKTSDADTVATKLPGGNNSESIDTSNVKVSLKINKVTG